MSVGWLIAKPNDLPQQYLTKHVRLCQHQHQFWMWLHVGGGVHPNWHPHPPPHCRTKHLLSLYLWYHFVPTAQPIDHYLQYSEIWWLADKINSADLWFAHVSHTIAWTIDPHLLLPILAWSHVDLHPFIYLSLVIMNSTSREKVFMHWVWHMSWPDHGGQALDHARESQMFVGTTNTGLTAVVVIIMKEVGKMMLDGIVGVIQDCWGRRHVLSALPTSSLATLSHLLWGSLAWPWASGLFRDFWEFLPAAWIIDQRNSSWALFAIQFGIAVLVVACPCGEQVKLPSECSCLDWCDLTGVRLAAPTAQMVANGLATQHGILSNGSRGPFLTQR